MHEMLGDPEVQDLHRAAGDEKNVRRFDVAVNDELGVGGAEPLGDLRDDVEDEQRIAAALGEPILERHPFEQFHHDEGTAAALAEIVDGADVGMAEGRSGSGLALEAQQGNEVVCERGRQHLQRHDTTTGVDGLVDDAHAATPEFSNELVLACELGSGHGRQWIWRTAPAVRDVHQG